MCYLETIWLMRWSEFDHPCRSTEHDMAYRRRSWSYAAAFIVAARSLPSCSTEVVMKTHYFRSIAGTAIMAVSMMLGASALTSVQAQYPYPDDRYRQQQDDRYRRD